MPNPYPGHPQYVFKVCLIGQGAVGKTCMARRLCLNTFDSDTKMTIGINFYTYDLPIIVNGTESHVKLSIWDFGGQEQFKKLFPYYINGVNGVFFCFSLVNFQSLIKLDWWTEELEKYSESDLPKIILGTKNDLVNSETQEFKINDLIIEQFLMKHNNPEFFKTSAKENENVLLCFKSLVKQMLEKIDLGYDQIP